MVLRLVEFRDPASCPVMIPRLRRKSQRGCIGVALTLISPRMIVSRRTLMLRRGDGRLLVALRPVRVLLLCAKHLFVAAARPSSIPVLRFELLDECSEMQGSGSREGAVLVLTALPNC